MSDQTDNAGYSEKPLFEKLDFKPGDSIFVDITPDWYYDKATAAGCAIRADLPATHAHLFFAERAELDEFLGDYDLEEIEKSLWVSWPKKSAAKSSNIKTDLTEQTFRDVILPLGWVDTKVAAIDNTWSGLKFLRRKK